MYNKILVPLDGSKLAEQVLPYARLLAEGIGAAVELLRVTDDEARVPLGSGAAAAADYLKDTAARCFAASTKVACTELTGRPAESIVDRAKSDPHCLIAMATHGASGLRRWLIGSVALRSRIRSRPRC